MILTIGVAADANVVIFERIKEEVRAGKSVRAAIATGYAKGFHTILDANVVTCITALVLFAVATAGVKGFALMLLIGTVISLLTAVVRHAGDARPARRLQLVRQPAPDGRARRADREVAADRLHEAAPHLVRDLRRRDRRSRSSRSACAASTSGSTSRAARRSRSRRRSRRRSAKVRTVTAKQGLPDAVIQGRAARADGGYKGFQIRTEGAQRAAADAAPDEPRDAASAPRPRARRTVSSSFGAPDRAARDPRRHRLAAPDRRSTSRSGST